MISVDTNILIQIFTGDDSKQAAATQALFEREAVWIAKTVLLEADWVLRSVYGFNDSAVRQAFAKLLGLDNVRVEDEEAVANALSLVDQGLDLADALHLSSRPPGAAFVSFDNALIHRAKRAEVPGASVLSVKI